MHNSNDEFNAIVAIIVALTAQIVGLAAMMIGRSV